MQRTLIFLLMVAMAACTSKPVSRPGYLQTDPAPGQHFTLGSAKAEVLKLHGAPNGISAFREGDEWWYYGASTVYFSSGKVNGWESSHFEPEPLKAYISSTSRVNSFWQGSTLDELVSSMGTPTGFQAMGSGDIWINYATSKVTVRNGIVIGWDDRERRLKLATR